MDKIRSEVLFLVFSILVVAGVVAAVHWPSLSAKALSFDDDQYLTENVLVKNPSWNSASRFLCEVLEPSTVGGYYQPLAMISLMLDYARGGRADNPRAFHETSLLLHLLNTALVILLIYRLFGRVWVAAVAGLLFGLHPMTVETIVWVGERKTVLAVFFSLLSLNFYVGYVRKGGWKLYAMTVLMYILALMSKPTSTPLPILMLVMDYWPLGRLSKAAILEKLPMLAIGGLSGVITFISQARTAAVYLPGQYSPAAVPLIVCYSLAFYISKVFYPVHLSSHYPFPVPFNLSEPMILAGVIGTLALIVIAAVSLRWTRALFAGLLFFFIAILPTMQIIGFSNAIASDKFAYLPSMGLLMIIAALLCKFNIRISKDRIIPATIIAIVVISIACGESIAVRRYLVHWRNTGSLYSYMISISPNAPILHSNLGTYYYKNGDIDKATKQWAQALVLNPDYTDALNNLAWTLATNENPAKRDAQKAVWLAERACQLTGYKDAALLDTLGVTYAQAGQFDKAAATARKAIQIAAKAGRKELVHEIEGRLGLYQQGKAYHSRQ
jgi:hypothetical protein